MIFSSQEQQRLVTLWQSLQSTLGKKEVNQFIRATTDPSNWLVDSIIRPRLFRRNIVGGVYYPVDLTKFSAGRNHDFAELIATDPNPVATYGADPMTALMLFANPLSFWTTQAVGEGEIPDEAPKSRVALGDHHIFTFEFDVPDVAFLREQLSWLRSSKSKLDCSVGTFYKHCSDYADFAGLTVCYSGNKSLHIHVVFEMALARARLGLDNASSLELRQGFAKHWERLHEQLLEIVDAGGHEADGSLRFAEAFRRLPNGTRKIEANHLLRIPAGTIIPQLTLWEEHRKRASGDELPLFFTPECFQIAKSTRQPVQRSAAPNKVGPDLSQEELRWCEGRLDSLYPTWPRFVELTYAGGRWAAKFRNSEHDCTPSSVMREDYSTVHLVGRDAAGLSPRKLPLPLGTMMRLWRTEMARREVCEHELDALVSAAGVTVSHPHPSVKNFRENVTDASTAASEMQALLRGTVPSSPLLFLSGPEGVGKTSTIMTLHHEFAADLERRGETSLAMYAFGDYKAAEEKCEAFNAIQRANGFEGVVLRSFSETYKKAAETLGIAEISTEQAARGGFPSRLAAIKVLQPSVITIFQAEHQKLWDALEGKKPVFFTVHQVMQGWQKNTPTRMMWARSFWDVGNHDHHQLRAETTLGMAIHDEVKAESIVDAQPEAVLRWVEELTNSSRTVWSASQPSLSQAFASYQAFVQQRGFPLTSEGQEEVKFEDARRIAALGAWDAVTTKDTGEYGKRGLIVVDESDEYRDIYGERHGRDWQIAALDWWRGLAHHTILLTTEATPTALARVADPNFLVLELEAPKAPRYAVEVHPSRHVCGANLAALLAEFRADRPGEDWYGISNKAPHLENTMTHIAARGSNALIGRDIVQTMTFMTPGEYERLQALNAWTGRSDLVLLRHVDEFNQTSGRNLGFRHRDGARHVLLVHRRLFELLAASRSGALGRARYEMQVVLDKHERHEATGRKKAA